MAPYVRFKAKIHKIPFPLGLRSRTRWGSLQRSPRPPSCIYRGLLLSERGEGREKERGGEREEMGGAMPLNIFA